MNLIKRFLEYRERNRLSYQLVLAVVICSVLFTLLAASVQLYLDYRSDVESIYQNIRFIKESYLQAIASSVYNFDRELLRIQLEGALQLQDIIYLEITEVTKSEQVFMAAGKPGHGKTVTATFPLDHTDILGNTFSGGSLTVIASLDGAHQRLWRNATLILISTTIQTFLVAFVILVIIQFIITRPLIDMARYTKQMDIEHLDSTLKIHRRRIFSTNPDELDQVIKAMNDLRFRLQQDITKRKQAEEALKASEEKYRVLVENAAEGVLVIQENMIRFVNSRGLEILGRSEHEVLGCSGLDFIHPEDQQKLREIHARRMRGEPASHEYDYRILNKKGDVRWLHANTVSIEWAELLAALVLVTDITERKQAEEEIRRLNAELEQRVRQRTAELEIANKELKSFAYVVSHDLKTPLRGIGHLANWLVEDYAEAFDEKGKEMTNLLIGRVKRMDNLIDGILKYSKLGRIVGEEEQIDLNTLICDVIDSLSPPRHIQITIEHNLPVIVGDKTHIIQVFQNLIGNALKFMDKPKGRITIGCLDESPHWTFRVADNGPGIDPKYHEKIFQIFQTLIPHDEHESTGIGLALVKKVVELYEGKIWVESIPGEGSVFSFTLPKKNRFTW